MTPHQTIKALPNIAVPSTHFNPINMFMIEKLMLNAHLNIHSLFGTAAAALFITAKRRKEKKKRIMKTIKNKLSNLQSMNFRVAGSRAHKKC